MSRRDARGNTRQVECLSRAESLRRPMVAMSRWLPAQPVDDDCTRGPGGTLIYINNRQDGHALVVLR
jgi:hypothetical protein